MEIDESPMSDEPQPNEATEGPTDTPTEAVTVEKPKKKQLSQAKLDQLRKARDAKRMKRELIKQQRVEPESEPDPKPVMNIVEKRRPRRSTFTGALYDKRTKRVTLPPPPPPIPEESEEDDESESDLSLMEEEEEPPPLPPRRKKKTQRQAYRDSSTVSPVGQAYRDSSTMSPVGQAYEPQTSYNQPTERDIYLDNLRRQMFGPVF